MTQLKIDYVEFPSTDGAASRQFFAAAFGWTFVNYGPVYDGIEGAGIDAGIDASGSGPAATLAIVRAEDLPAAEAAVVAAGGVITVPAFDFPGGRRFHFREPGGTELAVWAAQE